MTEEEKHVIAALARCRFAPATFEKRFVRKVAEFPASWELTEPQAITLWRIAYSWRRQLPERLASLSAVKSNWTGSRSRGVKAPAESVRKVRRSEEEAPDAGIC